MITAEQIEQRRGEDLHYGECVCTVGPRGGITLQIERWRVNGKVQRWKRRPGHWKVPVKAGLYRYDYITSYSAGSWHWSGDCPAYAQAAAVVHA